MSLRGLSRVGVVSCVVVGLGGVLSAVGLAAQQDQLTSQVCGRVGRGCVPASSVRRGQVFYLLQQGYANPPANSVLNFVDTASCPSLYNAEYNRFRAGQAVYIGRDAVGPGRFGHGWPVSQTKSASMPIGRDYVCSYLKDANLTRHTVTKPTYARASAKLTVTS